VANKFVGKLDSVLGLLFRMSQFPCRIAFEVHNHKELRALICFTLYPPDAGTRSKPTHSGISFSIEVNLSSYTDMIIKTTLSLWQKLNHPSCSELLAEVVAFDDPRHPGAIARLRKHWPSELVAVAISLTLARRKAAIKFDHPERLMADPVGVEQATSIEVGRYKARRFAGIGADHIMDLCCGIGGDAMALAEVADMMLIDADPSRAWMARYNVEAVGGRRPAVAVADVTTLRLPEMPFHIDPSRRTSQGGRMHKFEDSQPGGAFIQGLIDQGRDGAVKLSPGVDLENLPAGEIEIIAQPSGLVQAVLWTGQLSRDERLRTATRLPAGISYSGVPDQIMPCAEPGSYLLAVDPAVERAGLIGALCRHLNLPAIHPSLGLLTADTLPDTPWLTPYVCLDAMPWHEKKVRAWLDAHDGGEVIVKTRDKTVNPDIISRRLRGKGACTYILFVLRMDRKVRVWITQKV
jgi:hypothetical protein